MKKIKCNLSRILGEKKMKMSELAQLSGVSKTTILSLYHEKAKGVTFEVLEKIGTALDCEVSDLLEFIEE